MRAFRLANCLLSRIKLVETLREFPKRHASCGKTGNKNVQLLQNDLKSKVARFTTFVQTCLAANQAVFFLIFFYIFNFFIASNTHTEKKQKLHRINKVIKRKKSNE